MCNPAKLDTARMEKARRVEKPTGFVKVLLACFAALSGLADTARADSVLTFCYDPYPPYTLGSGGIPDGGLKVKLLEAVTDRIDGLRAVVVLLPWQRCLAQAESGEADGILPLFKSTARASYLAFTEPTFLQTNTFWYNRERYPQGLDLDEGYARISRLRLGMVNGSVIDQEMERAFENNNRIVRGGDVEGLMQMLLFGQLDLIAIDDAVGRYHVVQNGWQNRIASVATPISSTYSHFGLSRSAGADAYLDVFNRVISELQADGTIAEILSSTIAP
ncbi:transporter substrate-binding domain-containing protein [Leisingera sp. M527]|uniref:substrate-binding periplasmic protein n=1 Tax=Leisingera sp. M527 TaxID=2867014 RepID=UPI0021A51EA6|nr:transporter substrate-binding domain-containing protein [Leisingera sp. M527]UWQ34461.1 transporter substrate-binding domain-containing protein [Leisingera sp. M527]